MTGDRFNDGYKAAEAHWRKRWYAANADHQAAVTEVERLTTERRHMAARLAAVEALLTDPNAAGVKTTGALTFEVTHIHASVLRAVLSAAPTDTTKEQ